MGLKSRTKATTFFFGMSVIRVALACLAMNPLLKKDLILQQKSSRTISHELKKNAEENSSGPGLLLELIPIRAPRISASVTGRIREPQSSLLRLVPFERKEKSKSATEEEEPNKAS
ncbi:hypothetical protein RND81_01G066700 [Saponaria officinalis]|uniref:Uncharacterized protein n=1 Tax=Saponaria officinalis TaxID=3572 RepID=A0AAW1N637_SAPOF